MNTYDVTCIPAWTTDPNQAQAWLEQGHYVVVRHKLTGHSGQGIEVCKRIGETGDTDQVPMAPLYTMYKPKKHEFRIHIMGSEIVDMQQKKRRMEVPNDEVDWLVRSHAGGFVYARENIEIPSVVRDVALAAFEPTGLDFGAVDVIYQENTGRAYVLEINTAPGLEGTTLVRYAEGLRNIVATS